MSSLLSRKLIWRRALAHVRSSSFICASVPTGLILNFCRANHFGGHPHGAVIHGGAGSGPAQQKSCANRDGDCKLTPPMHAALEGGGSHGASRAAEETVRKAL